MVPTHQLIDICRCFSFDFFPEACSPTEFVSGPREDGMGAWNDFFRDFASAAMIKVIVAVEKKGGGHVNMVLLVIPIGDFSAIMIGPKIKSVIEARSANA